MRRIIAAWTVPALILPFWAMQIDDARAGQEAALHLTSAAFSDGRTIPAKHTCDGRNISPPLAWSPVPPGTKSFALIMDDPDATRGTWVHWVIYNIPPEITELAENVNPDEELDRGIRQGGNSSMRIGYRGPCPPSGSHRYRFKLYALDTALPLKPGATTAQVLRAMEGHVLAEARLTGRYR